MSLKKHLKKKKKKKLVTLLHDDECMIVTIQKKHVHTGTHQFQKGCINLW